VATRRGHRAHLVAARRERPWPYDRRSCGVRAVIPRSAVSGEDTSPSGAASASGGSAAAARAARL